MGDPCSGLRSLIAFFCLGLAFAYESRLSLPKKGLLVFAGFPLALFSNTLRVFFMGLIAEIYGSQSTEGMVHDASGIIVFVLAFILFMAIRKKLEGVHVSLG